MPEENAPLTRKRCLDRGFDKYWTVHREEHMSAVEAKRLLRTRKYRGRTPREAARGECWRAWQAEPNDVKQRYMAHLGDQRPIALFEAPPPADPEPPGTPRKVNDETAKAVGHSFLEPVGKWTPPEKKFESVGSDIAMRSIASAVAQNAAHDIGNATVRGGLAASFKGMVPRTRSKAWQKASEAAATPCNPLSGFTNESRSVRGRILSDEEIRSMLESHCRATRHATVLRLEGTLAGVLRQTPQLTDIYSDTQIYRRVRTHYPTGVAIGRGQCYTDRCPDCVCWDRVSEPWLVHGCAEHMDSLELKMPGYFRVFADQCTERGMNAAGYEKIQQLAWWDLLYEYVETRGVAAAAERLAWEAGEEGNDINELAGIEALFTLWMRDARLEVAAHVNHWTLRDHAWQWKTFMKISWSFGQLMVESDWAVPRICVRSCLITPKFVCPLCRHPIM